MKPKQIWIINLRAILTLYIIIHHLCLYKYYKFLYLPFGQGQFAVVLFWILSGNGVAQYPSKLIGLDFLKSRFQKLYPTYFLGLVVTYFFYALSNKKLLSCNLKSLLENLVCIQDIQRHPGALYDVYLGNTPLWYFPYLICFYILYVINKILFSKYQQSFSIICGLLGYITYHILPNPISHYIMYFPIWYAGFSIGKNYSITKIIMILILFVFLNTFQLYYTPFSFSNYPFLEVRHFLYTIFGVLLLRLIEKKNYFNFESNILGFIYKLSFPLFLIHYPIMILYNPFEFSLYWLNIICGFSLSLVIAYFINWLDLQLKSITSRFSILNS